MTLTDDDLRKKKLGNSREPLMMHESDNATMMHLKDMMPEGRKGKNDLYQKD